MSDKLTHKDTCSETKIKWEDWESFYDDIYHQYGYCERCHWGFMNVERIERKVEKEKNEAR